MSRHSCLIHVDMVVSCHCVALLAVQEGHRLMVPLSIHPAYSASGVLVMAPTIEQTACLHSLCLPACAACLQHVHARSENPRQVLTPPHSAGAGALVSADTTMAPTGRACITGRGKGSGTGQGTQIAVGTMGGTQTPAIATGSVIVPGRGTGIMITRGTAAALWAPVCSCAISGCNNAGQAWHS